MTRPIRNPLYCHKCRKPVVCAHCSNSVPRSTPMHAWIRELPHPLRSEDGFTATDIDLVWRNYNEGWFKLLEFKRGKRRDKEQDKKSPDFSQRSTLLLLDALLRDKPAYRGLAVIRTENASPKDSSWIWIEEPPEFRPRLVTVDELKEYLLYGKWKE